MNILLPLFLLAALFTQPGMRLFLLAGLIFFLLAQAFKVARIAQLEGKGIYPRRPPFSLEHVKTLLSAGEYHLALDLYRKIHPVSLKEAKSRLEELRSEWGMAGKNSNFQFSLQSVLRQLAFLALGLFATIILIPFALPTPSKAEAHEIKKQMHAAGCDYGRGFIPGNPLRLDIMLRYPDAYFADLTFRQAVLADKTCHALLANLVAQYPVTVAISDYPEGEITILKHHRY